MRKYTPIPLHFIPKAQRGGAWAQTMYGRLAQPGQLTQLLATPLDQGYNQQLDNARLDLQYQQNRRQQDQMAMAQEKFEYQKEQDLINQAYKEKLYEQELKKNEHAMLIDDINMMSNYYALGSEDKILPKHKEEYESLIREYDESKSLGENYKDRMSDYYNPRTRALREEAIEMGLVTDKIKEIEKSRSKIFSDPAKAPYIKRKDDEWKAYLEKVRLAGLDPNSEYTPEELLNEARSFEPELSELGQRAEEANVASVEAKTAQTMVNARVAQQKADLATRELDIEEELKNAVIAKDAGEMTIDEYNAKTRRLAVELKEIQSKRKANGAGKENLTDLDKATARAISLLEKQGFREGMPGYNEELAKTIQIFKSDYKPKDWENTGENATTGLSNYENIPVKEDGFTDLNSWAIPNLNNIPANKVSDVYKGETVFNYDRWGLTNDFAEKIDKLYGSEKTEVEFIPQKYGEGIIKTNDPKVVADLLNIKNPKEWAGSEWDAVQSKYWNDESGKFEIPFGDPDLGSINVNQDKGYINNSLFTKKDLLSPGQELVQDFSTKLANNVVSQEDYQKYIVEDHLDIHGVSDSMNYEKFNGLQEPVKNLALFIKSVAKEDPELADIMFTSFKREGDGTSNHDSGKSFDLQSKNVLNNSDQNTRDLMKLFDTLVNRYGTGVGDAIYDPSDFDNWNPNDPTSNNVTAILKVGGAKIRLLLEPKGKYQNKHTLLDISLLGLNNQKQVADGMELK